MLKFTFALRCAVEPVVKVSQTGPVGIITINRPKQLNALNPEVRTLIVGALEKFDADPSCSVMIITGEGKAFAAGADIKVNVSKTFQGVLAGDPVPTANDFAKISKPIIAAVNGFALGGGCEITMAADIAIASERAVFGQPEVKIGIIPGWGGTQRLPRAIGKAKAMEWVLTGFQYDAREARRAGLVSRVVKHEELLPTALKIAEAIAKKSQIAAKFVKQAVNAAQETELKMGLQYESDKFTAAFATKDRREGMLAFVEKRPARFTHE